MAKRVFVEAEKDDPEVNAALEEEEFESANEDTDGELVRSLQEMAGTAGAMLLFTRTYPNTPDLAGYAGEMTPAEFSLERMYEVFGPGRYRVRVKGPKGFLKGGGNIIVAKRASAAPGATASNAAGSIADVLRVMQEKEDARRREDSERRGRLLELTIPAAITGLTSVLAAMMSGNRGPDITGLITAMRPAPGPSITDLTTALANIKALNGDDKKESQIDVLLKVLDVAKEHFGGEAKGDTNWLDIVRDIIKEGPAMVQPLLENLKARQDASMTVATQGPPQLASGVGLPSGTGAISAGPAPPISSTTGPAVSPGEGNDMYGILIRTQTEKLLAWAVEQKRVELYAEVLLEELPAIVHQYVTPPKALEYLKHPQWFEVVTQYEPRLAAHRPWLDRMRRELIDIIAEQDKTPTATEGEEGVPE